jgi:hypothetical protein
MGEEWAGRVGVQRQATRVRSITCRPVSARMSASVRPHPDATPYGHRDCSGVAGSGGSRPTPYPLVPGANTLPSLGNVALIVDLSTAAESSAITAMPHFCLMSLLSFRISCTAATTELHSRSLRHIPLRWLVHRT